MREMIEVGEVWGIRVRLEPTAPWYDICVMLGVCETSGNCVALSVVTGMYIPDFSHDGMPHVDEMNGCERIL